MFMCTFWSLVYLNNKLGIFTRIGSAAGWGRIDDSSVVKVNLMISPNSDLFSRMFSNLW